jgi:hypothetical protein
LHAERHVAFRSADERVAEREQFGDFARAVAARACGFLDEIRESPDARQAQRRQALAHVRIGVLREKVRQLHDVAVGVVVDAALRVRHERIPRTRTVPTLRQHAR